MWKLKKKQKESNLKNTLIQMKAKANMAVGKRIKAAIVFSRDKRRNQSHLYNVMEFFNL